MNIAARTISAVAHVITGDAIPKTSTPIAPYLSGPKLVAFFNDFGGNEQYGQGFPSCPLNEPHLSQVGGGVRRCGDGSKQFFG
jgi:hypothetical protein